MPRRSIYDPVVQRAIQKRLRKREAKSCRKAVIAELREKLLSWPELVELTGNTPAEVAAALDALRIAGVVELVRNGKYGLVERGEACE